MPRREDLTLGEVANVSLAHSDELGVVTGRHSTVFDIQITERTEDGQLAGHITH